jgi:hypothetical protein
VGTKSFVAKIKENLGDRAIERRIVAAPDAYELKELEGSYNPHLGGKIGGLSPGNTYLRNDFESSIG